MVLRLCNCERGRMQKAPAASAVARHQWHSLWSGVFLWTQHCYILSRRLDLFVCCSVWTAEEEDGKAQTATCPHPQEVMGVQAGGAETCTVMAAEASVIGVEGLLEEVVSLQGGVAETGVEDHPEAAGIRLPDSMLS